MLHSNRILLDLGMPELDDRAFIREGKQIKPMVGGGGSAPSAPSSQTVTQTNIPEYARPYAEEMLGQGQALTDINQNPYTPYEGQRFAGFSPMQAQAFQNVAGQQVAPQIADASNIAYTGAEQGLGAQQTAQGLQQAATGYGQVGAQYGALGAGMSPLALQYGAQGSGIGGIGVQQAQQGFGAGQQYAQQATSPEAMQAYMSPYMQNVVDTQTREARRQSEIDQQNIQSQATQQGAFGGSRSAILEAERQRNLGTQLGDIQARGSQQAFEQAQQAQQFGAGLGIQGLQAGYQGLDVGLKGAESGLRGIQTGLRSTEQGIQGAQAGLQGVGQATDAGRYGLSGAEVGIRGAGQLGQLGGQQFDQEMNITDAMQKYGSLQQQQAQQERDFQYQQFLAQQQYPYQQLSYMSDLLRGVPSTQSAQLQYDQQPNQTAQLAGAGLAAYGAYNRKEGGQVKKYQEGGQVSADAMSTLAVQEMPSRLRRLSDSQLAAYARNVKDAITLSAIQSEMTRRARTRMPQGDVPEVTTAEGIAKQAEAAALPQSGVGMYGGGIVALQEAGRPMDNPNYATLPPNFKSVTDPQGNPIYTNPPMETEYMPPVENVPIPEAPVENVPITGAENLSAQTNPATEPPLEEPPLETPQSTAPQRRSPMSSFEAYSQGAGKAERSPEQQRILADMQERLQSKMGRAEKQSDTAKYDAILTAGLAMMSGTSLADGIARAAQAGGAQFMASKDQAAEAINAAEQAEMSFREYELALDAENQALADKKFDNFMTNSIRLQAAAGGGGSSTKAYDKALIRAQNDNYIKSQYEILSSDIASVEEKQAAIANINNRTQRIMDSFNVGDRFQPIPAPPAAEVPQESQSWFSRLFGSDDESTPTSPEDPIGIRN